MAPARLAVPSAAKLRLQPYTAASTLLFRRLGHLDLSAGDQRRGD